MPAVNSVHRVHHIYQDLEDGTLPPDLWNADVELAAIAYLAVRYPLNTAIARFERAVRAYNAVNVELRLPPIDFCAVRARRRLETVGRFVLTLPPPRCAAKVYRALLDGKVCLEAARAA